MIARVEWTGDPSLWNPTTLSGSWLIVIVVITDLPIWNRYLFSPGADADDPNPLQNLISQCLGAAKYGARNLVISVAPSVSPANFGVDPFLKSVIISLTAFESASLYGQKEKLKVCCLNSPGPR